MNKCPEWGMFKAKRLDNGEELQGYYAFTSSFGNPKQQHKIIVEEKWGVWSYEINPATLERVAVKPMYKTKIMKSWECGEAEETEKIVEVICPKCAYNLMCLYDYINYFDDVDEVCNCMIDSQFIHCPKCGTKQDWSDK